MIFILLCIAYIASLISNIFFLRFFAKNNCFESMEDLLSSILFSFIPIINFFIIIYFIVTAINIFNIQFYSKEKTNKIAKKILFIKDANGPERERYRKANNKKLG